MDQSRPSSPSYDVFISYSRLDNQTGWVSGLKAALEEDSRRFGSELSVFLDVDDVPSMEIWRTKFLRVLRSTPVLLVCLSPNYFASDFCREEWREYLLRQAQLRLGDDSIASVYFVEVPESEDSGGDGQLAAEMAQWRTSVMAGQHIELHEWFPHGRDALADAAVRERVAKLGLAVWERVERSAQARSTPGNLPRVNPYFVGRTEALRSLHATVTSERVGIVTAVQGLGGLGKTELVTQYAHAFVHDYPAGAWWVRAEGAENLLIVLGTLASELGVTGAEPGTEELGRAVLRDLARRSKETSGAALIVLDNMSTAALLGAEQIAKLPAVDGLRFVATTRLVGSELPLGNEIGTLLLDELSEAEGLELIRERQPARGGVLPDFASPQDEADARAIVRLLGGFTLAVEQAAVILGIEDALTPGDLLAGLERDGVVTLDTITAQEGALPSIRHQDKILGSILSHTLGSLESLSSAAVTAVEVAAFLPPETVPWSWLEQVTRTLHPELDLGQSSLNSWRSVRRLLTGRRLLISPERAPLSRMHRLTAAHLRSRLSQERAESLTSALLDLVLERAEALVAHQAAGEWEYGVVPAVALELFRRPKATENQREALAGRLGSALDTLFDHANSRETGLELAQAILEYDRQTISRDPTDARSRRNLADSLIRVAVELDGTDLAASRVMRTEALELSRILVTTQPRNLQAQRDLAFTLLDVGLASEEGYPTQALLAEALELSRNLVTTQPGNLLAQLDLSFILRVVGRDLRWDDGVASLAMFTEALELSRRLVTTHPGNLQAQGALAHSLVAMGTAHDGYRDYLAQTMDDEALELSRNLITAQPGNLQAQQDLASILEEVAGRRTDSVAARSMQAEALELSRLLAKAQPGSLNAQRFLSHHLHDTMNSNPTVDWGRIPPIHAEALEVLQNLTTAIPGSFETQKEYANLLLKTGQSLIPSDPPMALTLITAAVDIFRNLTTTQSEGFWVKRSLATALNAVGRIIERGDSVASLEIQKEALDIYRDLARAQPGNVRLQTDLAYRLDQIVDRLEVSDPSAALPLQAEAIITHFKTIELYRDLLASMPGDTESHLNLLNRLDLVSARVQSTDPGIALALLTEALEIRRNRVAAQPTDFKTQHDLAFNLDRIGRILEDTDPASALAIRVESSSIHAQALTKARDAIAARPTSSYQENHRFINSLTRVGSHFLEADPATTLALHTEALELVRDIVREPHASVGYLRDLKVLLRSVATLTSDPLTWALLRNLLVTTRYLLVQEDWYPNLLIAAHQHAGSAPHTGASGGEASRA